MPVGLYMDAHIPRAITLGLRLRRVDVLTAQEDHAAGLPDPELMERATTPQAIVARQPLRQAQCDRTPPNSSRDIQKPRPDPFLPGRDVRALEALIEKRFHVLRRRHD